MVEESHEVIQRPRERLELIDEPLRTSTESSLVPLALYLVLDRLKVPTLRDRPAIAMGKEIIVNCLNNIFVPLHGKCACVPTSLVSELTSILVYVGAAYSKFMSYSSFLILMKVSVSLIS